MEIHGKLLIFFREFSRIFEREISSPAELRLSCCSSDDKVCFDDAFLGVVGRQGAFDKADEHVDGLAPHLVAVLLDGGEHRFA